MLQVPYLTAAHLLDSFQQEKLQELLPQIFV